MSFRPNRQVATELRKQPAYKAEILRHAGRVKDQAVQLAPDGTSPRPGYASRFRLRVLTNSVRVINTDIAAHLIEWGSANNPPYAPLRRAVRAAGLRLEESLKQEDPPHGME